MKTGITLGIHLGHDRGAALVKGGRLLAQLSQERVDRCKHSPSPEIPYEAINCILRQTKLSVNDVEAIGISYTNVYIDSILSQIRDELADHYSMKDPQVIGVGHHMCHASAAYYTSRFRRALILIADGSGDVIDGRLEAESLYEASGNRIQLVDRRLQDFASTYMTRRNCFNVAYMLDQDRNRQISLGRKYEQITYLIGFQHDDAGKTMGLAPYGRPLVDTRRSGLQSLQFSLSYADLLDELESLRLQLRIPHHEYVRIYGADLARTVQDFIENCVITLVRSLVRRYQQTSICLGGGLFLNCVLNHKLLSRTPCEQLHINPAAGDDGQAVGAAFHAYYDRVGKRRQFTGRLPYVGLSHSAAKIRQAITRYGFPCERLSRKILLETLSRALARGQVIGIVRGRSEMGPRALCHRSILADPRSREMWDHLNANVKFREDFRPFAPVVCADSQFHIFKLLQDSPYMLLAAHVRRHYRRQLAAVTHVDGSARVQAIRREDDSFVYDLLKSFETLTGLPVLLNTSFNIAGEPIVESPEDALSTFVRSGLDILIIEDYLIHKSAHGATTSTA